MHYPRPFVPNRDGYASLVVRHGPDAIPSAQRDADGNPLGYLAAVAEMRPSAGGHATLHIGLGCAAMRTTGTGVAARDTRIPIDTVRDVHPALESVPRLYAIEVPSHVSEAAERRRGIVSVRLARDDPSMPVGRFEAVSGVTLPLQQIGIEPQDMATTRLVRAGNGQQDVAAQLEFPATTHDIAVASSAEIETLTGVRTLNFHNVDARDIATTGAWAALAAATSVPEGEVFHHAMQLGFAGEVAS